MLLSLVDLQGPTGDAGPPGPNGGDGSKVTKTHTATLPMKSWRRIWCPLEAALNMDSHFNYFQTSYLKMIFDGIPCFQGSDGDEGQVGPQGPDGEDVSKSH